MLFVKYGVMLCVLFFVVLLCLRMCSLHVLMRFVNNSSCGAVCGVCHCVCGSFG